MFYFNMKHMSVMLMLASRTTCEEDQVAASSSHWASVYTSDNTPHSQPVTDVRYPLPKGVSRSDWFNSYSYQKFQDKSSDSKATGEDEPGLIENVASAVGSVRQKIRDFGDGVVNSALGFVGVNKKNKEDNYQERQGPPSKHHSEYHQHPQHQQENQKYPPPPPQNPPRSLAPEATYHQYSNENSLNRVTNDELSVDSNNPEPSFAKLESVSPIEKFRLGVRSYLDPFVDPMVNPLKRLFQGDNQEKDRKQHVNIELSPDTQTSGGPLEGLTNFGRHVAGGFSKLTDRTSKMIFPWLGDEANVVGKTHVSVSLDHVAKDHVYSEARAQYSSNDILSEAPESNGNYYKHFDHENNLPLLPPLFIPSPPSPPPAPEQPAAPVYHQQPAADNVYYQQPEAQAADSVYYQQQPEAVATDTVYHVARPPYPVDVLRRVRAPAHPPPYVESSLALGHEEAPVRNPFISIYPPTEPPVPSKLPFGNEIFNEIPDQPFDLFIPPILKEALRRKKEIISKDLPSIFGFGAKKPKRQEEVQTRHVVRPAFTIPAKTNNVMYYLPSPDLSAGQELDRTINEIFTPRDTKLFPDDYFEDSANEILDEDIFNYVEKEEDLKDDDNLTTSEDAVPEDTIIVDLSHIEEVYETADEAYNEVVETEDDSEASAITDSSETKETNDSDAQAEDKEDETERVADDDNDDDNEDNIDEDNEDNINLIV